MISSLQLNRTRAIVVALVATVVVSAFALAWAAASTPRSAELASSDDGPGDVSGPCDEAENADKPECAGATVPADATPTSSSSSSSTTVAAGPSTGEPLSGVRTLTAADAGTITYTVDGGTLTLLRVLPADGWRVDVEQAGGLRIDLDLRSGTIRVQVDIEFEDGAVRERVRVRDTADDSRIEITDGVVTEVDGGPHGVDDNSGPDDHQRRGSDNSGHGSDDVEPDDSGRRSDN